MDLNDTKQERKKLVDRLVSSGYLGKKEVISAMLKVPRHMFIPEALRYSAYVDSPLRIGFDQTISAPHMVALMTEYLDVKPGHKILEIGSGSGYQAAVLSELVGDGRIYTVERIPELAQSAKKILEELSYSNVSVIVGEGTQGYADEAPYDRIIVTAGAPKIPAPLLEQLGEGGKLLIPVGDRRLQELIYIRKDGKEFKEKKLGGCMFVPLVGEDGW